MGCQKEAIAGGVITPGMLLAYTALGAIVAHAQAGDNAMGYFALEYDLTGRGIDDNYASDDQVLFEAGYPGAEYYALIADGENIAFNDPLTSNGDGALREAAAGEHIVAYAREAAAPDGAVGRCRVEIANGFVFTS
jgi:hypothetical protein